MTCVSEAERRELTERERDRETVHTYIVFDMNCLDNGQHTHSEKRGRHRDRHRESGKGEGESGKREREGGKMVANV